MQPSPECNIARIECTTPACFHHSEGVRDVYEADGSALEPKAPLAVLVNRGTASAAEV